MWGITAGHTHQASLYHPVKQLERLLLILASTIFRANAAPCGLPPKPNLFSFLPSAVLYLIQLEINVTRETKETKGPLSTAWNLEREPWSRPGKKSDLLLGCLGPNRASALGYFKNAEVS